MESGILMGSSCEPHFYIPIPLNAANTPFYGSCKLETSSVSSVVVRKTSIKYVYIRQYALKILYSYVQSTLLIG